MRIFLKILDGIKRIELALRLLAEQQTIIAEQDEQQWLDKEEVISFLNISLRTFYRLKKDGTIVSRRLGKRDYYFKKDLINALNQSIKKGRL